MNKTTKFFPRRYFMVLGTFLLSLLLYIDRVCISVAKDSISEDLLLSDKQMGWVLSVFALGYALCQTPSGILADKFGPRKILSAIVIIWSVFTAFTGLVWNFVSLLIVRFLFGAGEAGAFPSISRAVYSWIPMSERGLVTGINFSGSRLGAAFSLPLVAYLLDGFGWKNTFFILGLIGIIWAVVWYAFFRDNPEEHPSLNKEEVAYIVENRQQKAKDVPGEKLDFQRLLKSKNMWLAMGQYFCSNFTFFFALTWLFPHVKSKYGLENVEAGMYAAIPLIFGAFGNWFSGFLSDFIYKKGQWKKARVLPASLGFALAAIGLLMSVHMETVEGAILFLSLAIFGADMTLPSSWAFCIDIGEKHAGAVSGTMNMAGNVGAFITALLFPYIQGWTGSVELFFYLGALFNVIAIFLWLKVRPEKSYKMY
ncbi:MFS transporter [Flavicella sediminum]|uniref:MFS transporter n=1 Tax=Flavicella sediminum TaxID=2585141 RepID=UPI001124BC08|nr:MFS transporter [Flavicella sediminum]